MAGLVAMQLKQKRLKNTATKVDLDLEDEDKPDHLQTATNYFWQRNFEVRIYVSDCFISSNYLLQKISKSTYSTCVLKFSRVVCSIKNLPLHCKEQFGRTNKRNQFEVKKI